MSHFYSSVFGGRGEATRCGHKTTGIEAMAKNWHGKVIIRGSHEAGTFPHHESETDTFVVSFEPYEGSVLKETGSKGRLALLTLQYNYAENNWTVAHNVGPGQQHNVCARQAEFSFVSYEDGVGNATSANSY
jgi:hypothetical protein